MNKKLTFEDEFSITTYELKRRWFHDIHWFMVAHYLPISKIPYRVDISERATFREAEYATEAIRDKEAQRRIEYLESGMFNMGAFRNAFRVN